MIVVFDIGNVLLRWDPRNLYRKAFDDEARMERFLATALEMDSSPIPTPRPISPQQSRLEPGPFPIRPRIAPFPRALDRDPRGPIDQNVALLRRLKAAGRPVHALSNFAPTSSLSPARSTNFSTSSTSL